MCVSLYTEASLLFIPPPCSVSAAPYRSRSVVNLHHQDTETDEATMVLPPADYCDPMRRGSTTNKNSTLTSSTVTTNNHHHHSPTPSAASSSSSDHNTVSHLVKTL